MKKQVKEKQSQWGKKIYFASSSNAQLISHNPFRNRLFPLKACHRLVLELYISNAPKSVRVSNEKNSSILRFTSWSSNTTFFQCFLSVPGLKVTPYQFRAVKPLSTIYETIMKEPLSSKCLAKEAASPKLWTSHIPKWITCLLKLDKSGSKQDPKRLYRRKKISE